VSAFVRREVQRPGLRRRELDDVPHGSEPLHGRVRRLGRGAIEAQPVWHVHDVGLDDLLEVVHLAAIQRPRERDVLHDVHDALAVEAQEREGGPRGDLALDELDLHARRLGADEAAQYAAQRRGLESHGDLVRVRGLQQARVEDFVLEEIRVYLDPAGLGVVLHEVDRVRGEQDAELLAELVEYRREPLEPLHADGGERRFELHVVVARAARALLFSIDSNRTDRSTPRVPPRLERADPTPASPRGAVEARDPRGGRRGDARRRTAAPRL
jgi:hypothetical protein